MKQIFTYRWMLIAALTVTLSACNTNEDPSTPETPGITTPEIPPLTIDHSTFHFNSKATETLLVTVRNTTEWEVLHEAAWITAEKQSDSTLLVTATPARVLADRSATLTFTAADPEQGEATLVVTQDHGTPKFYTPQLEGGIHARHSSENGLWITGQKGTAVIVADVNKLITDPRYQGTVLNSDGGVHSIDNNGKPYGAGCNADGTMYTGYDVRPAQDNGADQEFFPSRYIPYIMRNNRKIMLAYPETTPLDNIEEPGYLPRHMYQGCIPDRMSADGKYIYGRMMNTNTMWFAAKWTRIGDTNEYTFKEIGLHEDGDMNTWQKIFEDFEGQTFMTIEPVGFLAPQNVSGLSQYGKYACGHYGASLSGGGQLFRYNMETEELQLLDAQGVALYITDDGTLFDSSSRVYAPGSTTSTGTVKSWIASIYGETIANQIPGHLVMGSTSADYSTTVLFTNDPYEPLSFIITIEP
jgi:hypothetical protein